MNGYRALFLGLLFLFVGCGGGGGESPPTQDVGGQPVGTASIVVNQTIAPRAVPASIDNVRITGFKYAIIQGVLDPTGGGETFSSRTFPLSTSYRLEDVPANTTAIRIEYLVAGQVVGLYVEDGLMLVDGAVYEINDPAVTLAPEVDDFTLRGRAYYPTDETFQIPIADYPFQSGTVIPVAAGAPDLESVLFEVGIFDPFTDEILALTSFTSSDPSIIEVSNSGLFNSSYRSGNLWGKKPGTATITANFFGIERSMSVEVINIRETQPKRYVDHILYSPQEYATVKRIQARGNHIDPGAGIVENDVDFTADLFYRPSDKPNVARWDTTPGREGYIIRGNEAGRVILWARLPDNPFQWLPYPVENRNN